MKISNPGAVLLCVGSMAIVGSSVSLSQLVLDYPALTGQAGRYAVAALALAAIAGLFPRLGAGEQLRPGLPTGRELVILTALAATGLAAFNACVLIGLAHADPPVVGTFIGAAPLGLALIGPLLRGSPPATRLVFAALIVAAGTALVEGTGHSDTIGLLASLGALGGEIAFSLLAAAVLPRLGPVRVSAYSCALAVPLLLAAAVPAGELARLRPPTPVEAATFGYLAAMMTVVAFVAFFTGLNHLGVERAGMIVGMMPLATLVTAAVQAGQLPPYGQSVGVLVVALGLGVGLTRSRRGRHAAGQGVRGYRPGRRDALRGGAPAGALEPTEVLAAAIGSGQPGAVGQLEPAESAGRLALPGGPDGYDGHGHHDGHDRFGPPPAWQPGSPLGRWEPAGVPGQSDAARSAARTASA